MDIWYNYNNIIINIIYIDSNTFIGGTTTAKWGVALNAWGTLIYTNNTF